MSSRADLSKLQPEQKSAEPRKATHEPIVKVGKFDKAFPVFLEGDRGVASGVGRNITTSGVFVETREPFPLGSRVRVTFVAPAGGAAGTAGEMTLEGEVRYQCFINFSRGDATRAGMRGIGLKFVAPNAAPGARKGGTVH